jgi:FSR family fosmidomycin resistance protein-like MFS transporter
VIDAVAAPDPIQRRPLGLLAAGFVAAVPLSLTLAGTPLLAAPIALPLAISIFMPSSVMVVLGQEYLPNQIGTASGMTLGLAVSIGGIAEPGLGALGDRWGLHATLLVLAALAVIAVAFSVALPGESRGGIR